MKQRIVLTESDLRRMIKESVKEAYRLVKADRWDVNESKTVNHLLNENKYQTYEQVEKAVYDYLERKYPDRNRAGYWEGWHDHQFAEALYSLGFDDDGSWYDCDAYTNGFVRVAIVWENGDDFWTLYEV